MEGSQPFLMVALDEIFSGEEAGFLMVEIGLKLCFLYVGVKDCLIFGGR